MPTAETRASARPAFQIWRKPQFPGVLAGPGSPVKGKNGAGKVKVAWLVMLAPAVSLASTLRVWVAPGRKGVAGEWVIVVMGGTFATDAASSIPSRVSLTVDGSTTLTGASSIVTTRLVKVAVTSLIAAVVT